MDPKESSKPLKTSVPRFTSFKAPLGDHQSKERPQSPIHKSTSRTAESEKHLPSLGSERRYGHNHQKGHVLQGVESRNESRQRDSDAQVETSLNDKKKSSHIDDLFVLDRKGDIDNIKYGAPNRYSVPRYRQPKRTRVLGLSGRFQTEPIHEHGHTLVTRESQDGDLPRPGMIRRQRMLKESDLIKVEPLSTNDAEADSRLNYLPLFSNDRKRRKIHDHKLSADVVSLRGKDVSSMGIGESQSESEVDDAPGQQPIPIALSDHSRFIREENARLTRLVGDSPGDIDSWLELIRHQEAMLAIEDSGHTRGLARAEQRGLSDMKLSLFEKALSKTKGHHRQSRLLLCMMHEGSRIWDTKKLVTEWSSVAKEYLFDLDLWMAFLNFQQTTLLTFSYKRHLECFRDRFEWFRAKETLDTLSLESEEIRLYLFLRVTTFIRDAGYVELAHALWQAILEFNFYHPHHAGEQSEFDLFQDFWDSETARFGEEGARGWAKFHPDQPHIERPAGPPLPRHQDSFGGWIEEERRRMDLFMVSAYMSVNGETIDPYAYVLFPDLKPYLFLASTSSMRRRLVGSFLCFHGLPSAISEISSGTDWQSDPFTGLQPSNSDDLHLHHWLHPSDQLSPFEFRIISFVLDTSNLFASKDDWFSPWDNLAEILSAVARGGWIRRAIQQLVENDPDDERFAEYLVALESQIDLKGARKLAKSLLKKHSSIRVYNAVALIELQSGYLGAAERVWTSIVGMRNSFATQKQKEIVLIWRTWLWALLDRKDFSRALHLCLAVAIGKVSIDDLDKASRSKEVAQVAILRTNQYLISLLDEHLANDRPDLSIHTLDILAVFTYLASNRNLAPSLAHYTTLSTHPTITAPQNLTTLTLLHQSRARILHLHATTAPHGFRMREITDPLASSLSLFPTNTIFLSLYHFHTRRALVTDRIREVIPARSQTNPLLRADEKSTYPRSIIPALFAIWSEVHRPSFSGRTDHAIRAAFENAVSTDTLHQSGFRDGDESTTVTGAAAHSPFVWSLYIRWEIRVSSSQTDLKSGRSKIPPLVHRAIRACPWHKELCMLGMQVLETMAGSGEARSGSLTQPKSSRSTNIMASQPSHREQVRGLYETMLDRGLRVMGKYWDRDAGLGGKII